MVTMEVYAIAIQFYFCVNTRFSSYLSGSSLYESYPIRTYGLLDTDRGDLILFRT